MTAKRLKVTKEKEKLSRREQLVPDYPRYTRDTFSSKLNPYLTDIKFTLKQNLQTLYITLQIQLY